MALVISSSKNPKPQLDEHSVNDINYFFAVINDVRVFSQIQTFKPNLILSNEARSYLGIVLYIDLLLE
jgi:hypothetical protein